MAGSSAASADLAFNATNNGKTYEIKASGYEQSWEQAKPSKISYKIVQWAQKKALQALRQQLLGGG